MSMDDFNNTIRCVFVRSQYKILAPAPLYWAVVLDLGVHRYLLILKGHSYENVCEIITLNDRLDPN
jgi:hypothetical protein